jgi:hypothetical protein
MAKIPSPKAVSAIVAFAAAVGIAALVNHGYQNQKKTTYMCQSSVADFVTASRYKTVSTGTKLDFTPGPDSVIAFPADNGSQKVARTPGEIQDLVTKRAQICGP